MQRRQFLGQMLHGGWIQVVGLTERPALNECVHAARGVDVQHLRVPPQVTAVRADHVVDELLFMQVEHHAEEVLHGKLHQHLGPAERRDKDLVGRHDLHLGHHYLLVGTFSFG
ncbi:hypothetical protein H257_11133 [Aphanomyces astaci]|uniref:Uncharacterized protein n=1 Tax=Aphanomyces astaci TaxID=112090 RepID=W4G389_APHAT|nr:hypothetical protein H257_11133 [Aphanomyces astaci]ETV74167.1 hypothetical protein H257_11133 [Aphanomyces astaci]|eukprot:XP_009836273.1 hypothetical protein H257_11133 [Aphanomyces astaci]